MSNPNIPIEKFKFWQILNILQQLNLTNCKQTKLTWQGLTMLYLKMDNFTYLLSQVRSAKNSTMREIFHSLLSQSRSDQIIVHAKEFFCVCIIPPCCPHWLASQKCSLLFCSFKSARYVLAQVRSTSFLAHHLEHLRTSLPRFLLRLEVCIQPRLTRRVQHHNICEQNMVLIRQANYSSLYHLSLFLSIFILFLQNASFSLLTYYEARANKKLLQHTVSSSPRCTVHSICISPQLTDFKAFKAHKIQKPHLHGPPSAKFTNPIPCWLWDY